MSTVVKEQSKESTSHSASDAASETVDKAKSRWLGLHRETRRTAAYVIAAGMCLIATLGIDYAFRPAAIKEYGKVGEEFYPEFRDPTMASGLIVTTIDADDLSSKEFSVEKVQNGQWVIPSHHNYPADAASRLAATASSIIGIQRGAMVSRWSADHARFGVVDPQTDTVELDQLEGIGKRLRLKGEGDNTLVDYIIGNAVEGSSDQYYVRHPQEDEVYLAKLDIDLSTKFTDWINADLLDLKNWEVRKMALNNYQVDELRGAITATDLISLSRETSSADWVLEGLSDEKQLKPDEIRETLSTLDGLEIVGVRPKQKGLTPDLRLDRAVLSSQRDVELLQADLMSRGFLLQPAEDGKPEDLRLVAREGELSTSTEDGLVYNLYFGRAFTGSTDELEFGLGDSGDTESADTTSSKDNVAESAATSTSESEGKEDEVVPASNKPGRYVFVRVAFDQELLGQRLSEPRKPEKSQELLDLEAEAEAQSDADGETELETSATESRTEDGSSSEREGLGTQVASEDAADVQAEQVDEANGNSISRLEELRAEFESLESDYEVAKREFESYQEKVTEGKAKVKELNRRFAKWYYVISGEDFDKLALNRDDLTEPKAESGEPVDVLLDKADSGETVGLGKVPSAESSNGKSASSEDVSGAGDVSKQDVDPNEASDLESREPEARELPAPSSEESMTQEARNALSSSAQPSTPEQPLVWELSPASEGEVNPVLTVLQRLRSDWQSWMGIAPKGSNG